MHPKWAICHLYAVHVWIVLWGQSKVRGSIKKNQPQINHTHLEGIWHMSHKHLCMMGFTLIWFLVSEQMAKLLRWLQLTVSRTSMGELYRFATNTFLGSAGGTQDFCRQCSVKNSTSKGVTLEFSVRLFFPSQWRNHYFHPCLSFANHTSVLTHLQSRTCFVSWAGFCFQTSSILFCLAEIVQAILRDQLK